MSFIKLLMDLQLLEDDVEKEDDAGHFEALLSTWSRERDLSSSTTTNEI